MCRYAFHGPYKRHMACFNCRIALKDVPVCPYCRMPMIDIGLDFKAPKRSDVKQWKKVEILYQNGITFHSCGCGTGYRPKQLSEVSRFVQSYKGGESEGEKLLEKFDRFAGVNRS